MFTDWPSEDRTLERNQFQLLFQTLRLNIWSSPLQRCATQNSSRFKKLEYLDRSLRDLVKGVLIRSLVPLSNQLYRDKFGNNTEDIFESYNSKLERMELQAVFNFVRCIVQGVQDRKVVLPNFEKLRIEHWSTACGSSKSTRRLRKRWLRSRPENLSSEALEIVRNLRYWSKRKHLLGGARKLSLWHKTRIRSHPQISSSNPIWVNIWRAKAS